MFRKWSFLLAHCVKIMREKINKINNVAVGEDSHVISVKSNFYWIYTFIHEYACVEELLL